MVAERLRAVQGRVAAAAERCGRNPASIRLVAVSKGRSPVEILAAYDAGQRDFGESRAQELVAKAPELPPNIVWHFVGPLQRNKASRVRSIAAWLHSMDRVALARTWAAAPGAPPALLEVNVAAEPQKHGVLPGEARSVAAAVAAEGVLLGGLMTVAPLVEDQEEVRSVFADLAELRRGLLPYHPGLLELSMGMSDDFEVAIEEGATMIRVGRAIFGPAQPA